jgi:hypothetical protein
LVLLLCFKLGLSSEVFVAIESLVEFSEEEEEDKEKLVTKDIGKEQHLCQIEKAAGGGLLGILEHGFFLKVLLLDHEKELCNVVIGSLEINTLGFGILRICLLSSGCKTSMNRRRSM